MHTLEKPGSPGDILQRRLKTRLEKPGSPGDIVHYGVKGMRWGFRKQEETSERTSTGKLAERTSTGKIGESTPTGKTRGISSTKRTESSGSVPALSEKQQARVDKFMKKSELMDTRISDLKLENERLADSTAPSARYTRSVNRDTIRNLESEKTRVQKDAEAVKKGKLTSTQKKVLIGAVVVGGLAAYTMYARGQQSGALNSWQLLAQQRMSGSKTPFAINKELTGKMSAKDILTKVVKPVNPGYSSPGGQMNCRRSTFAYELRRRGYDVHATTSAVGWGQSESGMINATTPGKRNFYRSLSMSRTVVGQGKSAVARGDTRANPLAATKIMLNDLSGIRVGDGSRKVFATLAQQPEGSRGEVLFKFPNFGHSMAYEIINGKPHVFDSQKGTYHDLGKKLVEEKWGLFDGAEITRLDNVDLDLKFLTRWADNN